MGRRRRQRGLIKAARTVWRAVQAAAVVALYLALNALPHRAALRAGQAAGLLLYAIDGRHRRLAQEQLQRAFPRWTARQIRRTARRCYAQLGVSAAEFLRLGRGDRRAILGRVVIEGLEHLEGARSQGRGVIFLTAHLGNWELMGIVCSLLGYRLYPVARPLDNPWINRLVNRIRSRFGGEVVSKKSESAPRDIVQALRGGDLVGMLLDQNMSPHHGVFVDFFGRPACTSKGLAVIARRTGAPVVPAFIVREGLDRHRILLQPPVELARTGDPDADLLANTARCTAVIERMVRAHPEQWLWLHRRWKTQPPAAAGNGARSPAPQMGGLRVHHHE
ncbi:MAG: lysophospholipid acyltransferase family protein [Nitrospirota bacterium]